MEKQTSSRVSTGILICLIIIALKPVPYLENHDYGNDHVSVDDFENEQVIHIGDNRIAIVDNHWNSGNHGNITVLEYNEVTKQFEKVSASNYLNFIE